MSIEIKAPTFPESITDGTVASWHKLPGQAVARDELIVDIETDKVVLEIVAPSNGVLTDILKQEGDTVLSDEVIALFLSGDAPSLPKINSDLAEPVAESADKTAAHDRSGPAVRRLLEEKQLDATAITGTGKDARITKADVDQHLKASVPATTPTATVVPIIKPIVAPVALDTAEGPRITKRVPMTRLRSTIAKRLVEAQQNAAMLTTYNEVNMKPIMDLRKQYKPVFEKTHNGARLGFMSFFVKAATEALKRFPAVNASIDGNDMVYHDYQDIGVAVSTQRGLVVPILRDTDSMSLAAIETGIADVAQRGSNGKLGIEDMQGGTFTITNGGVFGSLMSTPILNPPQTAILGMHKIQERPMAVEGEVHILPMMYLALSYDHRMIDGREAVQFLVTIKDLLEDPARILLQV